MGTLSLLKEVGSPVRIEELPLAHAWRTQTTVAGEALMIETSDDRDSRVNVRAEILCDSSVCPMGSLY